jgi:pilus assembly protein Flp/PilA
MEFMSGFFTDRQAATAIEYAIIASLIAIVIIVSLVYVSESIKQTYSNIGSAVKGANP